MYSFVDPINEGLKEQELRDLVHDEIHIDEFQAKLGEDADIIVVSFKVKYRPAAQDFEKFLEKGYESVLDAETSDGEYQNGWYLVFAEFKRRLDFPAKFVEILDDLKNVTNTKQWRFKYGNARDNQTPFWDCTVEDLNKVLPLAPKTYRELFDKEQENDELDAMLMAAAVNPKRNLELTEAGIQARILAGLPVDGYKKAFEGRPKRKETSC